jgi:hypothetical protein
MWEQSRRYLPVREVAMRKAFDAGVLAGLTVAANLAADAGFTDIAQDIHEQVKRWA